MDSSSTSAFTIKPTPRARTKTGCITCRIRRIKCDEAKPSCLKCTSTGRKCDGYTDGPVSRKKPPHGVTVASVARTAYSSPTHANALVTATSQSTAAAAAATTAVAAMATTPRPMANVSAVFNDRERYAFEFFRACTVPKTGFFFDSVFWEHIVPQISFSEPAVKHAVLALSPLLRKRLEDQTGDGRLEGGSVAAYMQYSKAVQHTSKLLEKSDQSNVTVALIVCILLISFEYQAGNFGSAQTHLQNGLQLLSAQRRIRGQRPANSKDLVEVISRELARLDLHAMTFNDSTAPYPYASRSVIEDEPKPCPDVFDSIDDARAMIIDLGRYVFILADSLFAAVTNPSTDFNFATLLFDKRARLLLSLGQWRGAFQKYCAMADAKQARTGMRIEQDEPATRALLNIYQKILAIYMSAGTAGAECAFDHYTSEFQDIVDLSELLLNATPSRNASPSHPSPSMSPFSQTSHPSTPIFPPTSTDYTQSQSSQSTPAPPDAPGKPPPAAISLSLGSIVPLYATATKCRDPAIRRKAIELLDAPPRRWEGIWDSVAAATVARWIVNIEETAAQLYREDPDAGYGSSASARSGSADSPGSSSSGVGASASGSTSSSRTFRAGGTFGAARIRGTLGPHFPGLVNTLPTSVSDARSTRKIRCAADIPEAARVHTTRSQVTKHEHEISVQALLKPNGLDGEWASIENLIWFESTRT